MNNKGFTLAELIGVLVILAILSLLSLGIFNNVYQSVLETDYNNLVIEIENKAEEYARDIGTTDVLYINVEFLIDNGYLQAEDGENIYDPRDNTSLNCYMIHVVFSDGEYNATFGDNSINSDGTCQETELVTGEITLLCNGGVCNDNWVNTDLTLTLAGKDNEDILNSTVEWTSLLGDYVFQDVGEEKILEIKPNTVLDTIYTVTIKMGSKTYKIEKNIKIDKEGPALIDELLNIDYFGDTQKLQINASDLSGSGISGIALTQNDCESATYSKDAIEINASGKFNLCLKDDVGNITEEEIEINEVTFNYNDTSNPNPQSKDIYYLVNNPNESLLYPTRNGYTFTYWTDDAGNRVYSLENLENGSVINGNWQINDIEVPVDKIDTDSVGVMIENQVNLFLLLDTSGSMGFSNKSNQLKNAVRNTINSMNFANGSTITIIQFTTYIKSELVASNNKNNALNFINSYSPGGDEDFALALNRSNQIIQSYNMEKDKTFIIFFTDGNDVASTSSERKAAYQNIKDRVANIYAVGLDLQESWKWKILEVISSPDNYFDASTAQANLEEIFWQIQEEIREEVTINSTGGLIELPSLYVSSEYPFILNINGNTYTFNTISDINDILTYDNNTYYLDLVKVDNKYKLNGDFTNFKFEYYYN